MAYDLGLTLTAEKYWAICTTDLKNKIVYRELSLITESTCGRPMRRITRLTRPFVCMSDTLSRTFLTGKSKQEI